MTTAVLDIGPLQLGLTVLFALVAGGCSLALGLGLGRDLLIGTVRSFAQLFLMGYVLKWIFALNMAGPVIGLFLIMVAAAAQVIRGRVGRRAVPFALPVFGSMLLTYAVVSFLVVGVVVGARPWWTPQYFIPLAGMVVGNSMTGIAVTLERLFSDLAGRRAEVEMKLALGADFREASHEIMAQAVRAGMIPSVNSLMGVGLVFLPGMMTGQILSGTDPLIAIRYQIVVMLMLTASTALGCVLSALIVRGRAFGPAQNPLI